MEGAGFWLRSRTFILHVRGLSYVGLPLLSIPFDIGCTCFRWMQLAAVEHTVKWSSDQQVDPGPKQFGESCWHILGTGGRDSLDNHCIFLWVGVMKPAAPQLLLHRIPFPLFMNFLGGYPWSTLCQCGDLVPPARGHSSPATSDRSGWSCRWRESPLVTGEGQGWEAEWESGRGLTAGWKYPKDALTSLNALPA